MSGVTAVDEATLVYRARSGLRFVELRKSKIFALDFAPLNQTPQRSALLARRSYASSNNA